MIGIAYEKMIIADARTDASYLRVKHPTGLEIVIWKMPGFSTTDVLFATKYGSVNTRFKTDCEPAFLDVPAGIAHFLEHKLFENEDCDVFELYAKTGANANAYTSFDHTAYTFSATQNVTESLKILLSFVQKPYFTQETVDKEQGIIGQEIRLCEDSPERQVFFNLLKALYVNNAVRIDIAGTVESIAQIDAQLLYRCYYTFYNLNNMVLSIAGDVDEDEILAVCDELLVPCKDLHLTSEFPDEPALPAQARVELTMPVGLPLFDIGFKCEPAAGMALVKQELEAAILLQLLFGATSPLYQELFDEGLINSQFGTEVFSGEGFFALICGGESRDPDEVFARIKKEIARVKTEGLDREMFDIIKKSHYGSMIRSFNSTERCADLMLNAHFAGVTAFASVEAMADISFEGITDSLKTLFDTAKCTISVVSAQKEDN
ncbi:MAG: pitrilysin family protein [Oscillospiraceae bacterium]